MIRRRMPRRRYTCNGGRQYWLKAGEPQPCDSNDDIGTDTGIETWLLTDDEREQLQLDREAEQDRQDLDRESHRQP